MSRKPRSTCLAVTAATVLAGAVAAAPAGARAPGGTHNHCVVTIGLPDGPAARCGAAADTGPSRSGTLLMTWYADADYQGDTTDIREVAGPCASLGYGISDIGGFLGYAWNDRISSFRVFHGCSVVFGFEHRTFGGDSRVWTGDQPYVGDAWNDRISSLLVSG